jgi:D-cysteine desulfhydrase/L-cysteate sulfo-lyase
LLDLSRFPSLGHGHLPTPLEPLPRLGAELGVDLWVKRDDLTGIAFGGNKIRQLNFYIGQARAEGADTLLITGAVQSNFVRSTAAMAAALGMSCHVQLEERVKDVDALHRSNGNALLDQLFGARLHSYPQGEDEAGADAALQALADDLRARGARPYVIPLGADHAPLGALGYVDAAREIAPHAPWFDALYIASGSALTHIGLFFGLRALGMDLPVIGVCVRRDKAAQHARVSQRLGDLATLLGMADPTCAEDIQLTDKSLAPGYGQLSGLARHAITRTARSEGLLLDPVYTAKVMAALITDAPALTGKRVLFWHTGGQPALFAYGDGLL